jgi:carbon monoxide dehydrogenase subunit G
MTKLSEHLETALPRQEAFDYVADWGRQAEWDPNTVSSRRVGEGAPSIGARYALEVKMGPRTVPMEYRITELSPPERVVLVGEGSGVWSEDVITFSDTATGTRVDYQAEIRLSGLLGLMEPLLGRAFDGIAKGAVKGLKRELDARAATSPPNDAPA